MTVLEPGMASVSLLYQSRLALWIPGFLGLWGLSLASS